MIFLTPAPGSGTGVALYRPLAEGWSKAPKPRYPARSKAPRLYRPLAEGWSVAVLFLRGNLFAFHCGVRLDDAAGPRGCGTLGLGKAHIEAVVVRYRHIYACAIDMPSAMADMKPSTMTDIEPVGDWPI